MYRDRTIIEVIIGAIIGIILFLLLSFVFGYKFYHIMLFFIFLYTINIFIHEIGHMVFGKLVKINTWKIQIGEGQRVIFKFRFFGTRVEVTNRIGGGFCFSDYFDNKNARTRFFISTLGGLFFTICVALLAYLVSTNIKPESLSMVLKVFYHSNIFSAIFNLIPSKVNYLGKLEPNDALKLIQIPFYNEKQLQEFLISARILHASDLIRGKKYTEAKEILEKTEEIAPLNINGVRP